MRNADTWVLDRLGELEFEPYTPLLDPIRNQFVEIYDIETEFVGLVGGSLTKRQAVALGLLARTFQLSISMLVNQLMQNYAGWNCSYRALLETFFVVFWLQEDSQRYEAYYEETTPGIGKIKATACAVHPQLRAEYDRASDVTHVSNRALHLPWRREFESDQCLPFTAVEMSIAQGELASMLAALNSLLGLLNPALKDLLLDNFSNTQVGEKLWDQGVTNQRFGCLGFEARLDEG